jgi:GT2 family glycosyltransferase
VSRNRRPGLGKVCISYLHPGQLAGLFVESLLELYEDDHRRRGNRRILSANPCRIAIESGPRVAAARNQVVRTFLESDVEWLWMLDADMCFRPAVLDQLLEAADPTERPIVGGLYFHGGRTDVWPSLYLIRDPATHDGEPLHILREYPDNALVKVDGTGGGCLLMHREALVAIGERFGEPSPWFMETVHAGREFGEDITFCLRANALGIPVYVHTGVEVGHVKPFVMNAESYRRRTAGREEATLVGER